MSDGQNALVELQIDDIAADAAHTEPVETFDFASPLVIGQNGDASETIRIEAMVSNMA